MPKGFFLDRGFYQPELIEAIAMAVHLKLVTPGTLHAMLKESKEATLEALSALIIANRPAYKKARENA